MCIDLIKQSNKSNKYNTTLSLTTNTSHSSYISLMSYFLLCITILLVFHNIIQNDLCNLFCQDNHIITFNHNIKNK